MPSRKIVGVYGYLFLPHPKQFRKRPITEEHKRVADYFRNPPIATGVLGIASDGVWEWIWEPNIADFVEQGKPIPSALLNHIRNRNYTPPKGSCDARVSGTDVGFYWLCWCFFNSRFCLWSLRYWILFPLTMILWLPVYSFGKRGIFDHLGGMIFTDQRPTGNTGANSNG